MTMYDSNDTENATRHLLVQITGPPDSVHDILIGLGPLISNKVALKLEIVFQITLFTVSSFFGIVANIVNIKVYWKQGLKDSITVGLFALSISDFFVVFFPLFTAGCYMADHLLPDSPIRYVAVAGVSATQARGFVYSLSCTLTAFLSIERCFCVIRPFKVKLVFTRRRMTIVIISFVVFYTICFAPMFFVHQLRWQPDRRRNFSETFTLWYHPTAEYIMAYNYSVSSIVMPTVAQAVVIVTAIVMTDGLRKASKFRKAATKHDNGNNKSQIKDGDDNNRSISNSNNTDKNRNRGSEVLDSRDARLVKTMVILVAILSAANIPYIVLKYVQIIVPEVNPRKRFANVFRLMSSINFLLGSLNASSNALVYYFTGSRYREIVKDMFCRKK